MNDWRLWIQLLVPLLAAGVVIPMYRLFGRVRSLEEWRAMQEDRDRKIDSFVTTMLEVQRDVAVIKRAQEDQVSICDRTCALVQTFLQKSGDRKP